MQPPLEDGRDRRPDPADEACWPPESRHPDAEVIRTNCADCGLSWRIHEDLAGYRLQCRCGSWVDVPGSTDRGVLLLGEGPEGGDLEPRVSRAYGPLVPAGEVGARRGALEEEDLIDAPVRVRARWTNRTIIELVLVMVAFWGPSLVVQFTTQGTDKALYMPLAGVAASLMVLAIGMGSRYYAFSGLTLPRPRFILEALGITVLFLLAATGWLAICESLIPDLPADELDSLQDHLGLPMTFFVIAICPGVFEELAFRGMIQGRLTRLLGTGQGALVTGFIFALAHGITLGFPLHIGIGIYLCFLRLRSASLVPGILLHVLYNGTLVVL